MNSDQYFKDELLTWLQLKIEAIKVGIKCEQDSTLIGIMRGQLDSYLQVIAWVMSEGKLQ